MLARGNNAAYNLSISLRYLAHNGEINTLRGNHNLMKAREGVMKSSVYGDKLAELYPVVEEGMSDSGCVDNVLEFLCMAGGRELPEVSWGGVIAIRELVGWFCQQCPRVTLPGWRARAAWGEWGGVIAIRELFGWFCQQCPRVTLPGWRARAAWGEWCGVFF